jgi:hypothetical protein
MLLSPDGEEHIEAAVGSSVAEPDRRPRRTVGALKARWCFCVSTPRPPSDKDASSPGPLVPCSHPHPPGTQSSVEALQTEVVLHCVGGRLPSACTRGSHAELLYSPPPTILSRHVWEGTRHRLIDALACALSGPANPYLMRLTDASLDTDAVCRAWTHHVRSCDETAFTAISPLTEGTRRTLQQTWEGTGLTIQHDLEDDARDENPIIDFLQAHPHLKHSGLWLRIMAWLEKHVGPISRRPAFISGAKAVAHTTTHYDEYDSVAFVLMGCKTFYVAPPHLVWQTGRGRRNESSAHPLRPGSPHEQATPQPFFRVDVPAGSLLYLPRGWWHFVVSRPQTAMVCSWI